jgi:hypothetical protein
VSACAHPVLDLSRLSPELRELARPSPCDECGLVSGFDLTGWNPERPPESEELSPKQRRAFKRSAQERQLGLGFEDEASRWLREHDPSGRA